MSEELKTKIAESLDAFQSKDLYESSMKLFQTLGYDTSRIMPLKKPTWQEFKEDFIRDESKFDETKARINEWKYIDLLFQLTRQEITNENFGYDGVVTVGNDKVIIETYLFFAIELSHEHYSRTALSSITREINNLFSMPAMILFKHGKTLTISIINRRLGRRDPGRDVLEKVTLIKDINIKEPHRGHLDILFELSLNHLLDRHEITNFVELHNAWQKTLDIKILNKKFFQELSNWYFWAQQYAVFPTDKKLTKEKNIQNNLIRLLTRMIFVWFLKEKGLIPSNLFKESKIKLLLKSFDPDAEKKHSYYQAILQNLFFGTLNQQMSQRAFVKDENFLKNREEHGIKNKFRYAKHFNIPENEVLQLFAEIPFLNGGLFDCLDKDNEDTGRHEYIDGFTREASKAAKVPDMLFFADEQILDLSKAYGYKRNKEKCRGLFRIFNNYKFTVEENTPVEEEIALDPELLGKVFENLLAYYNPETETTARKQTGSFYTPREIVNYMVDESLIAYLKTQMLEDRPAWLQLGNLQTELFGNKERKGQLKLEQALNASKWKRKENELDEKLRKLIAYTSDEHPFTDEDDIQQLIYAIDHCKILDPACGSGAFPMGILHKLVYVLGKLDENNTRWKELQKRKTQYEIDKAVKETDKSQLQEKLEDISRSFKENASDYGRKLYLIENCIYGVDIQPIAVQISKLRFFISLVVDQKENRQADNCGIRPLPNLETKFVAANTLIGLGKPEGLDFRSTEVIDLETQLRDVRHQHFEAKTRSDKQKFQKKDKAIRKKIAEQIKKEYAVYEKSILIQIEQLEQQLKLSAQAKVKEAQKKRIEKAVKDIENKITKLQEGLIDKQAIDATADKIAQFDIYSQNEAAGWFEAEWMYGKELEGGFNIVIGNPPYLFGGNKGISVDFKKYAKKNYKAGSGKINLFALFIEKGIKLLKDSASLTYILPNTLLRVTSYSAIRELLVKKVWIQEILDLDVGVFENVTASTIVLSVRKQSPSESAEVKIKRNIPTVSEKSIKQNLFNNKGFIFNIFSDEIDRDLISKINSDSQRLGDLAHRIRFGVVITKNIDEVVGTKQLNREWKHFLEGDEVAPYLIQYSGRYLHYEKELLHRSRTPDIFETNKIIIQRITGGSNPLKAAFDQNYFYNKESLLNIILKSGDDDDYKYVLALLNSKLLNWFYSKKFTNGSKLTVNLSKEYISELPIKEVDAALKKELLKLVSQILSVKERNPQANTVELENKIDIMVYKVYGLTNDEIKTIEAN